LARWAASVAMLEGVELPERHYGAGLTERTFPQLVEPEGDGSSLRLLQLNEHSEEDLLLDLELLAEEFSQRRCEHQEYARKLRQDRKNLIDSAKYIKDNRGPMLWTPRVAESLQNALTAIDMVISGEAVLVKDVKVEVALEKVDQTKLQLESLDKIFFQHELQLNVCLRICMGWTCIAMFCYLPFLVPIYVTTRRVNADPEQKAMCSQSQYITFLLAFAITATFNCIVNCLVSSQEAVDRGNTW
jgi:hypothetical protein